MIALAEFFEDPQIDEQEHEQQERIKRSVQKQRKQQLFYTAFTFFITVVLSCILWTI